jgi:hypothetical protein
VHTGSAISLGLERRKRLKDLKAREFKGPASGTTGGMVDWLQKGLCFEARPVDFMQPAACRPPTMWQGPKGGFRSCTLFLTHNLIFLLRIPSGFLAVQS